MELNYTYAKIKKIAKEVKKTYPIGSIVEAVQYVFADEDILSVFVREGADLKDNGAADELIGETMAEGVDYFDIQQEVIKGLIRANFYKTQLQEMLKNLTVSAEVKN